MSVCFKEKLDEINYSLLEGEGSAVSFSKDVVPPVCLSYTICVYIHKYLECMYTCLTYINQCSVHMYMYT